MEKIEQRVYIRVSASLNQSAIVIHDNLVKGCGEAAYSYPTAARWAARFKVGESNFVDETCSGHQLTETIKANI